MSRGLKHDSKHLSPDDRDRVAAQLARDPTLMTSHTADADLAMRHVAECGECREAILPSTREWARVLAAGARHRERVESLEVTPEDQARIDALVQSGMRQLQASRESKIAVSKRPRGRMFTSWPMPAGVLLAATIGAILIARYEGRGSVGSQTDSTDVTSVPRSPPQSAPQLGGKQEGAPRSSDRSFPSSNPATRGGPGVSQLPPPASATLEDIRDIVARIELAMNDTSRVGSLEQLRALGISSSVQALLRAQLKVGDRLVVEDSGVFAAPDGELRARIRVVSSPDDSTQQTRTRIILALRRSTKGALVPTSVARGQLP